MVDDMLALTNDRLLNAKLPLGRMSAFANGPDPQTLRTNRKTRLRLQSGHSIFKTNRCLRRNRLGNLFFHFQRISGKLCIFGLCEKRVQTTAVVNSAQCSVGDFETERAPEAFGHQCHVLQVRQEPATGAVFGVADIVARHRAFSSQFATARHVVILVLTGALADRPPAPFSRAWTSTNAGS